MKVVIGGVIPPDDVAKLKGLGVDTVFTTGTRKDRILDDLQSLFE
jgi:methylmalonyl-CoA mutase cobalamin-binding domain/chain